MIVAVVVGWGISIPVRKWLWVCERHSPPDHQAISHFGRRVNEIATCIESDTNVPGMAMKVSAGSCLISPELAQGRLRGG